MRKTNVIFRCDFCTREVTTSICPGDWLEVPLKFDDGMTDIPDVVEKHLCAGCAKQTVEVIFPLKAVPFARAPWRGGFVEKIKESDSFAPKVAPDAKTLIILPSHNCIGMAWRDAAGITGSANQFPTFDSVAEWCRLGIPCEVEVEVGYRTQEALAACKKYGWKAYKWIRVLGDEQRRKVYIDLTTGEVQP